MIKTNVRSSSPTRTREISRNHSRTATVLSMPDRRAKEFTSAGQAASRRDQILAETAHDLNNALSVVRLQLELLALDVLPQSAPSAEAVWHRLRLIQPAVAHATDILKQLMHPDPSALGRNANGPRPIALSPVVQRMVPILSAMLPPGITLHLRLTPDLDEVAMDPVQVVRIVSNLVLNSCAALARGAKSEEGKVTLEIENAPTPGWIVLRVRDTGSGMPSSTQRHLARPDLAHPDLARLVPPSKPPRRSTHLGLASVRRMVHRAGGRIEVESAAGAGTDISILLPCANPTPSRRKNLQASKTKSRATVFME